MSWQAGWSGAVPRIPGARLLSPVPLPLPPAGEYIALYQNQRAVLKERHREKEEYISRLAQDKEDMKVGPRIFSGGGGGSGDTECLPPQVKLLELQELVLRLVGERNEWYGKFLAATQNPAGEPSTPPAPQELDMADSPGGE